MLDINYIKENPTEVVERLAAKGKDASEDVEGSLAYALKQAREYLDEDKVEQEKETETITVTSNVVKTSSEEEITSIMKKYK